MFTCCDKPNCTPLCKSYSKEEETLFHREVYPNGDVLEIFSSLTENSAVYRFVYTEKSHAV